MSLSINFAVVSFVDIFRLSSPQGVHDSEPLVVICCGNPIFVCFHDRVVCQIFGGARHVIFVVFFVFFLVSFDFSLDQHARMRLSCLSYPVR